MKATAKVTPRCSCSTTRLIEALVEEFAGFGVDIAVAVAIDPVGDAVETLLAFRMLAIWLSPSTRTRPIPLWRSRLIGHYYLKKEGGGVCLRLNAIGCGSGGARRQGYRSHN